MGHGLINAEILLNAIDPISPFPSRICVYLCKYTYERVEKFEFGIGQYAVYAFKLSGFAKIKKTHQKHPNP